MSKVKFFTCQKTCHYVSQCPRRNKGKGKTQDAISIEVEDFTTKFENEFYLVPSLSSTRFSGAWLEGGDAWVVDNAASSHMIGMRSMFLSVSEIESNYYARCGVRTMHVVNPVGTVVFQVESRGSLEVVKVMHVPKMKINFLLVSNLEYEGYVFMSQDG